MQAPLDKRWPLKVGALLGLLIALAALAFHLWHSGKRDEGVQGGPISMASTQGAFSLSQLEEDQLAVVSFGYTFCPDVCPITQTVKRQALAQLDDAQRARVVPVMITVDLERDTLARMREYMEAFGSEFVGLVGTPGELADVTERYGVAWQRTEAKDSRMQYTVDHTSALYVVDREGEILEQVLYSPTPAALVSTLDRELTRREG